jgi:hypothetical protein
MNKKYLILFVFAALITFLPISCDIKNPVEGITVRVKNIPRTTSVRIEFLDQISRNLVSTDFTIKFSGKNKGDVISDVNIPISEMTVKGGIAYFAIKDNIIPSTQNPVEIVVVAQSNQYLSTSSRLFITKTGPNNFSINMLKNSGSLPTGINQNEQSFGNVATSTGTTTNIVATSGGTLAATLTVPAGTILRDANNNPLSGAVNTQLTYFNASSPAAIPSFPGGFSINANTRGNGNFMTAGFAAINMTVNGVPVENFSGNATVRIQVSPNVINPNTGTTVRPGDIVPMWSYNESTGQWKFEGDFTINSAVGPGGNQTLYVEKSDVTHLSWWNLDWFFNSCNLASPITFTGGCWDILYWFIEFVNGQGYVGQGSVTSNDPIINLINAPSNQPVRILVFDTYNNLWNYFNTRNPALAVASQVIQNLCTGPTNNYTIPVNTQTTGQNVNLTIRGVCPNGNILDQGTLDIEILRNGFWQFAGRIINGQLTLRCLQLGQTYNFRTFYNGQYYFREQQITSANMVINIPLPGDIDFCR